MLFAAAPVSAPPSVATSRSLPPSVALPASALCPASDVLASDVEGFAVLELPQAAPRRKHKTLRNVDVCMIEASYTGSSPGASARLHGGGSTIQTRAPGESATYAAPRSSATALRAPCE